MKDANEVSQATRKAKLMLSQRIVKLWLVAIWIVAACTAVPAVQPARATKVLSDGWLIKQLDAGSPNIATLSKEALAPDDSWMRTRMPAQVQDVLLERGRIPDPHIGRNAAQASWIWEKDWAYACTFASPPSPSGPVFLRFKGLDTLATAYLNGSPIGSFDDMFREYAVDVRKYLAPRGAANVLLLVFSSVPRFLAQVRQPPEEAPYIGVYKYLRKSDSDFKSYLGASPNYMKVGIFDDVILDVPGAGWIDDVWVQPELAPDMQSAGLRVAVETSGTVSALKWTLADASGQSVEQGTTPVRGQTTDIAVRVRNPKLWWPRGYGAAHLYSLRVSAVSGEAAVDERTVSFGIRSVRPVLRDAATGEPRFKFEINGRPMFLMGAGWAPVEGSTHRWHPQRARRLLDLMAQGNMNLVRIWAEGDLPPQDFYNECDRRGILVWQDFMFGYGVHPERDPALLANMKAEVEGMVRTLRNHPSVLLYVGGNENHMGYDFAFGGMPKIGTTVFDKIIPEVCARLDPSRLYHKSSPYGGPVPNWPLEGDWHDYTTLTFSSRASVPAFASEVGRVSPPSLASMRRFISEEDLWPRNFDPAVRRPGQPAWPPEWAYHNATWDKIGPIEQYPEPSSAADLIRVLGTAHGEYLGQRVERERRGVPDGAPAGNRRCWGNMIWRLNDTWPIIYFSAIDYYLEPKIPYYYLRRAYEPVLVSFERSADKIAVWVTNDSPESVSGRLAVRRRNFAGAVKGELNAEVQVGPAESKRCLDLTAFGPINLRDEFLEASFGGREAVYQTLIGERYLRLPAAKLTVRPVTGGLEITTSAFARQVVLEIGGETGTAFDDNFFDLAPGVTRTIAVTAPAGKPSITVRAVNAEPVSIQP